MDLRFERVWAEMSQQRRAGARLDAILRHATTRDLIAALAGVGEKDPVAANAIATELLNRQTRAPFFGAFLVSIGVIVATFVVDMLLTGSPFFELSESRERGYVMATVMGAIAAFSLLMFTSWRGRVQWTGRLITRARLARASRRGRQRNG